jgi:DNA ligase (NAD+)
MGPLVLKREGWSPSVYIPNVRSTMPRDSPPRRKDPHRSSWMLRSISFPFLLFLCLLFCPDGWSAPCPKLLPPDAQVRVTTLTREIRRHNRLYYEQMKPEITDAAYDRLFEELVLLESCFPDLAAVDSPTRKVGGSSRAGAITIPHDRPMLSLTSSIGPEATEMLLHKVVAVSESATLLVQPKVDGLPVELTYESGRLVLAATRGNGRSGEEVTERARQIKGLPVMLTGSVPGRVVVRGEVYAERGVLAASTDQGSTSYATLRNHAAGALLSRNPDPSAVAALRLFPFELVNAPQVTAVRTDREALQLLVRWGFPVQQERTVAVTSLDKIREVYRSYLAGREKLPFAVDGIVVKVDDLELRRRLGEGSRAPFWAAAWKFPPLTARTVVKQILWQVGKSGRRTPVAQVAPVRLGGTLVGRVSLHNTSEVARLGLVAGDEVIVALEGDVIPQIVEVVGREPAAFGTADPAGDRVRKLPLDACLKVSPGCRDQFLSRAVAFTSPSGVTIRGLGRGRLKLLMEAGLVTDLPSIFRLTAEDISAVPGLGTEIARKVTESVHGVGRPELQRVLAGLAIPGVGPVTARRVAQQFSSLDELLAADELRVKAAPGNIVGPVRTIQSFFGSLGGGELLLEFRELGLI